MWVLPKTVSLQIWKHHWRTSRKRIPRRITTHMHARATSNVWKHLAVLASEDRRNRRTKRKVWKYKRKTNGDRKDL